MDAYAFYKSLVPDKPAYYSTRDLMYAYFSENSGLVPAYKYSMLDHQRAFYLAKNGPGNTLTLSELETRYYTDLGINTSFGAKASREAWYETPATPLELLAQATMDANGASTTAVPGLGVQEARTVFFVYDIEAAPGAGSVIARHGSTAGGVNRVRIIANASNAISLHLANSSVDTTYALSLPADHLTVGRHAVGLVIEPGVSLRAFLDTQPVATLALGPSDGWSVSDILTYYTASQFKGVAARAYRGALSDSQVRQIISNLVPPPSNTGDFDSSAFDPAVFEV